MSRTPSQATHRKQRGAALMVILVIIVLMGTTYLVNSLGSNALKISQNKSTSIALAQAKEALIGYAVTYGDANLGSTHGYLPCPDEDELGATTEGEEHATCGAIDANAIGRFPWKTLGLPPLKDGNGECLWYAVSGTYKSNPASSTLMNWDNTGKLSVFTADGVEIAANEIVAVVFSPGSALSQDRSGATAPICGGNYTASAYLDNDADHGINNSNIAIGDFILPHEHRDINGSVTATINDQLIYITRQDIWRAVQLRIAREARTCLDDYAADVSGGTYPWAAPLNTALYTSTPTTLFGRIPDKDPISSTDSDILAIPNAIIDLQAATNACIVADNSVNQNALDNAGDFLENLAKDIKNKPPTIPPISSTITSAAKTAGDKAQDSGRCAKILADPINNTVQTNLNAANDALYAILPDFAWPGTCTLFGTNKWNHWKELVFFQVADGFKPGSAVTNAASCDASCLWVDKNGLAMPGSGKYKATVMVAGGNLVASRTKSNLPDYLELDNQLPKDNPALHYKTYDITDINYQITNDLVLCLNARKDENCK